MVRVTIDGQLFAEAKSVVGWWNGFAEPVFSFEEMRRVQAECVRLGWDNETDDGVLGHLAGWKELADDEWASFGWVWEVVK